jgi:hypothetical protein
VIRRSLESKILRLHELMNTNKGLHVKLMGQDVNNEHPRRNHVGVYKTERHSRNQKPKEARKRNGSTGSDNRPLENESQPAAKAGRRHTQSHPQHAFNVTGQSTTA